MNGKRSELSAQSVQTRSTSFNTARKREKTSPSHSKSLMLASHEAGMKLIQPNLSKEKLLLRTNAVGLL
jgi:hypothetical protein